MSRYGRKRGCGLLLFGVIALLWTVFALSKRFGSADKSWPPPFQKDTTLVFQREDLRKIWEWEIASGHYPSSRKIPEQIALTEEPVNPALPPSRKALPSRFRPPPRSTFTSSRGIGSKRVYLDIQARPPNVAYPPRPVPGSVADLDIVMDHCDFSQNKYVRDCLEVLRLGAGLDNENRMRRGRMDEWKYIYVEQGPLQNATTASAEQATYNPWAAEKVAQENMDEIANGGSLTKKRGAEWEPPISLPDPLVYHRSEELNGPCDPDHPRVYHMFWTGPFTDKPYLALLSYLFTQNLGLHDGASQQEGKVCRPQFWMWINPGPAAAVPNPNARREMFDQLKSNPWASPFLHPRFKDVIQFKMWNTTEQLDGIPELKEEWRALQETLFNSGGHVVHVPQKKVTTTSSEEEQNTDADAEDGENVTGPPAASTVAKADDDDMLNRLGSTSSNTYDRLSVILSDMARFVLCHRFGGIYLDADTILLRDWEELWGWKGAFAYRWSRLETYNTAVLHLNKGSALGTFLFRTALKNLLDFHPMTVSEYAKDSFMEGLLLRLPDALFDSAWLNTEYYQRDRPPQPYFTAFEEFFETPSQNSAAPQALGFEGFFRGAYSYHFHNFWWKPFDPSRNWPDLGPRFAKGERKARAALKADKTDVDDDQEPEDKVSDDKRDLDWATVLKRTFESYIRGERPNMYGEWLQW